MHKLCEICKKLFEYDDVLNPHRRFCSKTCYITYLRRGVEPVKKSWFVKLKEFCKSLFE